jgi:hypothetical protein
MRPRCRQALEQEANAVKATRAQQELEAARLEVAFLGTCHCFCI